MNNQIISLNKKRNPLQKETRNEHENQDMKNMIKELEEELLGN